MKLVIDPIEVQFHLAHDCIRGCIYVEHINNVSSKSRAWVSISDMCYSESVVSWNQIFGTNSQNAHWKKLLTALPIPVGADLEPFRMVMVTGRLNITEGQWKRYHKEMVDFRNSRLAHFDFSIHYKDRPSLTWALQSACLYREWLLELLRVYKAQGHSIGITETTEEQMIQLFRNEIVAICR
jgi:hypothetical protein